MKNREYGKKTNDRSSKKQPYGKRGSSKTGAPYDEVRTNKSSMNDPGWYATNAQLLSDSASLAYS